MLIIEQTIWFIISDCKDDPQYRFVSLNLEDIKGICVCADLAFRKDPYKPSNLEMKWFVLCIYQALLFPTVCN